VPKKKRELNTKAVFRIFWEHTKRYPWMFGVAVLGGIINQITLVYAPTFVKDIFNIITSHPPIPATVALISVPLVLYMLVSLVGWVGSRLEMWLGFKLIAYVTADLTKLAFNNLMRHSYQFFTSSFSGALTRRVGRFSGAYENLYYSIVTTLFQTALYVLGVIAVLTFFNWTLGLIVFLWAILFVTIQWRLSRWQQPLRLIRAEEDTNLTATLADSISNQNTVALFSANVYEEGLVSSVVGRLRTAVVKAWTFDAVVYGVQGLLSIALNVGMLWIGVHYWQQGLLTIGDLVLIQTYVFGIFGDLWNIGRQFRVIYNGLADASEMVEVMETPYGIKDIPRAAAIKVTGGAITFDHVEFYFQKSSPVLHDFSLAIAGRQKVALVGPSGAGKSTITKLLLRLYDVPEGSITIDGQNIAEVTQDSLRDAVSFVPQEPILFHRTLLDNIRYGRRDATDEEVIAAARAAHCHEFIERLPLKYQTYVGERGIKLSGGERQRVAIARAILKDSPILVLDEATSSLDSESEMLIQDALATLMQNKTVLVIAHRLSTIMKMDRIVVLEGGSIVADGTHEELLKEGGLYHKLWSIQAGGFLLDEDASTAELAAVDEEE
jgi:ATP-binding cassette subfamily B protein